MFYENSRFLEKGWSTYSQNEIVVKKKIVAKKEKQAEMSRIVKNELKTKK